MEAIRCEVPVPQRYDQTHFHHYSDRKPRAVNSLYHIITPLRLHLVQTTAQKHFVRALAHFLNLLGAEVGYKDERILVGCFPRKSKEHYLIQLTQHT